MELMAVTRPLLDRPAGQAQHLDDLADMQGAAVRAWFPGLGSCPHLGEDGPDRPRGQQSGSN